MGKKLKIPCNFPLRKKVVHKLFSVFGHAVFQKVENLSPQVERLSGTVLLCPNMILLPVTVNLIRNEWINFSGIHQFPYFFSFLSQFLWNKLDSIQCVYFCCKVRCQNNLYRQEGERNVGGMPEPIFTRRSWNYPQPNLSHSLILNKAIPIQFKLVNQVSFPEWTYDKIESFKHFNF